jgi:hypothetical protein
MPELLATGLESQKRMVRAPAMFLGVVSHPRSYYRLAVDYQNCGIQIEDQAGALERLVEKSLTQQVVDLGDLSDMSWSQPLEESSDRGLVREPAQSHDFLEGPVVLQDLCLVDPLHPSDDGIENGQDHLGRMEIAEARGGSQMLLEQMLYAQLLTKTLDEQHSSEVCQGVFLEGDRQNSQTFRHCTQYYLLGSFLCKNNIPGFDLESSS